MIKQRKLELDLLVQPIIPDVLPATPWDMYLALVGDDSATPQEIKLAKQSANEFISYIDVQLKRFPKSRPGKVVPEIGKTRREIYQTLGVLPLRYCRDYAPRNPGEAIYLGKKLEGAKGWKTTALAFAREINTNKAEIDAFKDSFWTKAIADGSNSEEVISKEKAKRLRVDTKRKKVALWEKWLTEKGTISQKKFCLREGCLPTYLGAGGREYRRQNSAK